MDLTAMGRRPPKQRTPSPPLDLAPLKALLASARLVAVVARMDPGWRRDEALEDAAWAMEATYGAASQAGSTFSRVIDGIAVDAAWAALDAGRAIDSCLRMDLGPTELACRLDRLALAVERLDAAVELVTSVNRLSEDQGGEIRKAKRKPGPKPDPRKPERDARILEYCKQVPRPTNQEIARRINEEGKLKGWEPIIHESVRSLASRARRKRDESG